MNEKHINKLINELPIAIKFNHDSVNTIYYLYIYKVNDIWRICYATCDTKVIMIVSELEAEEVIYVDIKDTDFINAVQGMVTLLKQIEHYIVYIGPVMNIQLKDYENK